jgi:hypothetical protein
MQSTGEPIPAVDDRPAKKQGFFDKYLDPVDRLAEVIYGVLIVMTFTLAFRGLDASMVANGTLVSEAVQRLFVAAFGCAVAWGIIDGVMYILTSLFERADRQRIARTILKAASEDEAVQFLSDEIDDPVLDSLTGEERDKLYRSVYRRFHTTELRTVSIQREDIYGAFAVFVLAVIATLPVALPFLLTSDPLLAMRLSNIIAILMLFFIGFRWAKYIYANPWKIGLSLAVLGVAIVLIAIPLGG